MDWIFGSPQNSYVEPFHLSLQMMVLGGEAFGRGLGLNEVMRADPHDQD